MNRFPKEKTKSAIALFSPDRHRMNREEAVPEPPQRGGLRPRGQAVELD